MEGIVQELFSREMLPHFIGSFLVMWICHAVLAIGFWVRVRRVAPDWGPPYMNLPWTAPPEVRRLNWQVTKWGLSLWVLWALYLLFAYGYLVDE
jgi:hypothetical protein